MAENSKIQWTDHTFNPWRGCTKVSPGCAHCYADTLSKRNPLTLGVWGPNGTRVVASEAMWREPVKWNRDAAPRVEFVDGFRAIERLRVFCASLADVFEDWWGPMVDAKGQRLLVDSICAHKPDAPWLPESRANPSLRPLTMNDVRARLFALIDATPNLDWLLLTKRPENIAKMLPGPHRQLGLDGIRAARFNVWLGASVENQATADDRIPHLLKVPAAVRFLSVEPLLGPVDLTRADVRGFRWDYLAGEQWSPAESHGTRGLDWVIVGGESGPGARPCNMAWIRSIVEQCKAAGVACFVKQLGSNIAWDDAPIPLSVNGTVVCDKKGGDISEFPDDLRVREFPTKVVPA